MSHQVRIICDACDRMAIVPAGQTVPAAWVVVTISARAQGTLQNLVVVRHLCPQCATFFGGPEGVAQIAAADGIGTMGQHTKGLWGGGMNHDPL